MDICCCLLLYDGFINVNTSRSKATMFVKINNTVIEEFHFDFEDLKLSFLPYFVTGVRRMLLNIEVAHGQR
jgi:hypothetical protein